MRVRHSYRGFALSAWSAEDISGLRITNATDHERAVIRELFASWRGRLPKNHKRSLYYDTEQAFKDRTHRSPQLADVSTSQAGTLAVRKPALRSQFGALATGFA